MAMRLQQRQRSLADLFGAKERRTALKVYKNLN